jgi:hypothetical protein
MAEGDNDRPQVTQSPNSDEPSSISPLDIRSVSQLATDTGPLGPSEPPKRSIPYRAPVSRSVPSGDPPLQSDIPISQEANRPTERPVLFGASDALSKLAASAAAGQAASDKIEDAKRRARGISRAPPPPPSLPNAHYPPDPPPAPTPSIAEPVGHRDESIRGYLDRAVEESARKTARTAATEETQPAPPSPKKHFPCRVMTQFFGLASPCLATGYIW